MAGTGTRLASEAVPHGRGAGGAGGAAGAHRGAGVSAQEQPAKKLTFTVGIINDVDSLNRFIGILAESYEVWR